MTSHRFALVLAAFLVLAFAAQAQDKVTPDQIPKKVMDALKAKFPKARIDVCTREKEGNDVVYDIEFKQEGRKFEADIKEDGSIHNWERQIAAKDLPAPVLKTVQSKYPKATLKDIMLITAVKDAPEGFEITLTTADKKEVEVTVAPDGKLLEDSSTKK